MLRFKVRFLSSEFFYVAFCGVQSPVSKSVVTSGPAVILAEKSQFVGFHVHTQKNFLRFLIHTASFQGRHPGAGVVNMIMQNRTRVFSLRKNVFMNYARDEPP